MQVIKFYHIAAFYPERNPWHYLRTDNHKESEEEIKKVIVGDIVYAESYYEDGADISEHVKAWLDGRGYAHISEGWEGCEIFSRPHRKGETTESIKCKLLDDITADYKAKRGAAI